MHFVSVLIQYFYKWNLIQTINAPKKTDQGERHGEDGM